VFADVAERGLAAYLRAVGVDQLALR